MSVAGEEAEETAFAALSAELQAAIAKRGFDQPTAAQTKAIPPIVDNEHVLLVAPTGSGKTEAAMLPVLDALREGEAETGFGALYITPLRALNRDMRERLEWWGETLDLDIDVRHGDTSQYQRQQQAKSPPDVLVTTPETLQAMLTGSRLREGLADVQHIIVDEIHELAGTKRGAQLAVALERLRSVAGPSQRIGLSATVGDPKAIGQFLTGDRGCTIRSVDVASDIDLTVVAPTPTKADEELAGTLATEPKIASHLRVIAEVIERNTSTLIFVNTRQTAEALGSRFKSMDVDVGIHHGSLAKAARIEVEAEFKNGEIDALLCTSSMELGIDVGRIDHVVQYQSPRQVTRLLQRIGRAGHRIGRQSRGTIVATRADDILESIAIAEAASEGAVEPARVHHGSLDTLANQIVGIVMDEGEIAGAEVFDVIRRADPFADVTPETVRDVIEELARNGIVWLDEEADELSKTGQTWQYFYDNLSMIPDEATYTVADMARGSRVGTLDERFVVNFAEPGAVFVQRGEMWRIVEIDDERERVQVTPIEDPSGEVPSWTGEEIPVPSEIAQRVGRYRQRIANQLESDPDELAGVLPETVAGSETVTAVADPIERQLEMEAPIPTDRELVVEAADGSIVVHACFGHRANETLGRILAALLGQQTGSSIGIDVDPYRIELEVPHSIRPPDVIELFETTDPEHVEAIIELTVAGSDGLHFRLAQVATKFGSLKRWESDTAGLPPRRLLGALRETPMYDEAVRELVHQELDPERAGDVLRSVQEGDRTMRIQHGSTPIGRGGRSSGIELLSPQQADASVIRQVKERLMNDRVRLSCVHCTEWSRELTVERVEDQPTCPECGSTRIAALNPWDEETISAIRKSEKDDEAERLTKRAHRSANLVQSHGKQAVIALAARGVGPQTGARILANLRESEADFYRDLLEQERQYARTRSFWD